MKLKLTFLFCVMGMVGMGQITFQKTYGGTATDKGYSVQQTSDGGYIITGFSTGRIAYLIKTGATGDTVWTKTFGGTDVAKSVQQTTDGGYIMAGTTYDFGAGDYDFYLIKTNAMGDTLWTKTYGGTGDDEPTSVWQTADGGYIITGETGGLNSFDVYLIRTDAVGNTLWTKAYGGINTDFGECVKQTADGYIITGLTSSFGAGAADVYLIWIGDSMWTKTYGGAGNDQGFSVQQTTDGGYVIVGVTRSFGAGQDDVYLIKTDGVGDTLWTKTYGGTGNEEGTSVQQTTDGGYIIAGMTSSFGAGYYDIYLIKTNAAGDALWSKTFGGTGNEEAASVQQTADGGYIIAGYTTSFGDPNDDVYLIKTDSLGNSGCNQTNPATIVLTPTTIVTNPATLVSSPVTIVTSPAFTVGNGGVVNTLCPTVGISEINNQPSAISIYPNPSTGIFYLRTNTQEEIEKTEVYNYMGEKVFEQRGNIRDLNLSAAAAGIYFVKVKVEGRMVSAKVVKE